MNRRAFMGVLAAIPAIAKSPAVDTAVVIESSLGFLAISGEAYNSWHAAPYEWEEDPIVVLCELPTGPVTHLQAFGDHWLIAITPKASYAIDKNGIWQEIHANSLPLQP